VPQAQHTPTLFEFPSPVNTHQNVYRSSDSGEEAGQANKQHIDNATVSSRLYRTIDDINRRYGKNALYYASSHHALDHAPMRIAFTRIPDIETER